MTIIAPKDDNPVVYIVSDSIGETAELVAKAAVSQFNGGNVQIRRVPYVNDPQDIVDVLMKLGVKTALLLLPWFFLN
ncbi:hypothetical protein N752_16095 [Desulforamulus aquiferis]|nr:hypothetical protein N752_16095 [Desulforamulus aquiferis]